MPEPILFPHTPLKCRLGGKLLKPRAMNFWTESAGTPPPLLQIPPEVKNSLLWSGSIFPNQLLKDHDSKILRNWDIYLYATQNFEPRRHSVNVWEIPVSFDPNASLKLYIIYLIFKNGFTKTEVDQSSHFFKNPRPLLLLTVLDEKYLSKYFN